MSNIHPSKQLNFYNDDLKQNIHHLIMLAFILFVSLFVPKSYANDFLPAEQAFVLNSQSMTQNQVQLNWQIAPDYYLYHNKFQVLENGKAIALSLPKGQPKNDPTFGLTDVHHNQVTAKFTTKPHQNYQVIWQGCASSGLCYPPQRKHLQTDATGLLLVDNQRGLSAFRTANNANPFQDKANTMAIDLAATPNSQQLFNNENKAKSLASASGTVTNTASQPQTNQASNTVASQQDALTQSGQNLAQNTLENSVNGLASDSVGAEFSNQGTDQKTNNSEPVIDGSQNSSDTHYSTWNNDQTFLKLLNQNQSTLNLFLFLGFGVLLAFLPCSLPLIPILSSVLIGQQKGYRAVFIASCFVLSMAMIYAIMGMLVASLGYSFQRFFQQAWVLALFAGLFVVFALNLFGYFELTLPQKWLNRLHQINHRQTGGKVGSAMVMGALSALIVGPCMSAPLAGALLYVSQLQNQWLGALHLFALGLGIGIPVFVVSVFGTRFIPKAGHWMNHLKVLFGFLMLAMAVYFIRPLLNFALYQALLALVSLSALVYVGYLFFKAEKHHAKIIFCSLGAVLLSLTVLYVKQAWSLTQDNVLLAEEERVSWQKVRTQDELNQTLATLQTQAKQQNHPIIIDVYADWCVSCQPIEHQVLPNNDVQSQLANVERIKLDLSEYEPSQDEVLKNWQILGPPTMLFLDAEGKEYRDKRLTGTFTAKDLLQRLDHL
ncbi:MULTISPECIES: protein-disulfide reductase DsbD [unclassified Acinetobacter]|uniref:protein-disulfide reductase DsbD n=1 Tax=unclassified Acinetobacter TaxID=196816 RepID=UPI0035B6E4FE